MIIEILQSILQTIISVIQQFSGIMQNYAGGLMLLAAALFAVLAYRKTTKVEQNLKAMERLADAIVRYHTKEKKEED